MWYDEVSINTDIGIIEARAYPYGYGFIHGPDLQLLISLYS